MSRIGMAVIAAIAVSSCVAAPPPTSPGPSSFVSQYGGTETMEDGLFIQRYPDGSGSVSTSQSVLGDRWRIACGIDAMSDRRECQISSKIGGPFVYYGAAANPQSVCIMGHDFPGRRGMIRVDSNAPIETDADGCVSAGRILSQMMSGSTMTTRRYEWPYDWTRDETTSLTGFSKTVDVIRRIRAGE